MGKDEIEKLEKAREQYYKDCREWQKVKPPRWRFIKYRKWLKNEPILKI